ncbi:uncharacterized protein MYCFIDRAFT_157541 [Pseudocercospora fijiensis CIRAD86]|uniref:Uncharacterized protein n=1 Tax=Pseudocercospora fijiensis (strain CIRAD86) TaxID=383855 RepID=M3AMZ7_PSEFD|nr:uncharacterized protein MYCFIDRAFT_157541 [Pseudocercospora fijiensis CIRAD86]EME78812.1 hypothetical protein MYCFIDRAFT_157541 [Pseudocercospora fijiensis CIRAD86]
MTGDISHIRSGHAARTRLISDCGKDERPGGRTFVSVDSCQSGTVKPQCGTYQ